VLQEEAFFVPQKGRIFESKLFTGNRLGGNLDVSAVTLLAWILRPLDAGS
jgi:hypothetical protein